MMPKYLTVLEGMPSTLAALTQHLATITQTTYIQMPGEGQSDSSAKISQSAVRPKPKIAPDFVVTSPGSLDSLAPLGIKPDEGTQGKTDEQIESLHYERKAAQKIAKAGFDVRYSSDENLFDESTRQLVIEARRREGLPPHANFDLLIEGRAFDVYSPKPHSSVSHILQTLEIKSETQARRIVIYAREGSSLGSASVLFQLQQAIVATPPPHLREVFVVKRDGTILRIFPAEPPRRN